MKKNRLFIALLAMAFLAGCSSNNNPVNPDDTPEEPEATLEDVSFPDDEKENSPIPTPATLPSEDSEAIPALTFSGSLSYYNNNDLHNLDGQWNNYGIHSPYIFKYNSTYYLYTSTPSTNVGIRAYKSNDLINWTFAEEAGFPLGYISKQRETFGASAPRVIFKNDLFYLYFNSSSGYYLFTSTSPEGPFTYSKKLNISSNYNGYIYQSPVGKLFFVVGGDKDVSIYDMVDVDEVDLNSKATVKATMMSEYNGGSVKCNNPHLAEINGTLFLTYSQLEDKYVSYRSDYVFATNPDYSSSYALANSFYNFNDGPFLLATNVMDGDTGLGDLSIIEGPDMVSYYAYYTSRETDSTRRINISPIYQSGSALSLVHRETRTPINNLETSQLDNSIYDDRVLTEENLGERYVAYFGFKDVDEIYFNFRTKNNTYAVSFDAGTAKLVRKENGLGHEIATVSYSGHAHEIKVIKNDKCDVYLDGVSMTNQEGFDVEELGKIGFMKNEHSEIYSVLYLNQNESSHLQDAFKPAEGLLLSGAYLGNKSIVTSEKPLDVVTAQNLKDNYYLDLSTFHDYARWLIDVKESGHYGVELIYNASFGAHESSLGLRVGQANPEYIYKTEKTADSGFVRTRTAEFDVEQGINELLVENLSNDTLHLVAARLVKLSSHTPSYSNPLNNYATKGIHYETDFVINEAYECHQTYEGARSFAYVGDNTIGDFELTIDVAFSSGIAATGYVNVAFRCNNFASTRFDNDESCVGYYLEISQYRTRLVKHNYGYGVTMDAINISNSVNAFANYKISMVKNTITVYRNETMMFTITDPYAYSSGHLGFGAYNTIGLIRNIDVHSAN